MGGQVIWAKVEHLPMPPTFGLEELESHTVDDFRIMRVQFDSIQPLWLRMEIEEVK